jgi:hypothetical protein
MSAMLGQVAITAQIKTSCLGLTRTDKSASEQSTVDHRAIEGAGRVVVSRLAGADEAVKGIRAIQKQAQDLLKSLSTPWNGRQLMPNVNLEPFLREFKYVEAQHQMAIDNLIDNAPELIAKARANLGDYSIEPPTLSEIRAAFKLEFVAEPIPDTSRFSASNLDTALENSMREQFEANTQAAYSYAQEDVLHRVAEPLKAMVERLNAYNEREDAKDDGKEVKGGYFRDTLVTNVQDIAHVFNSFNLFNDPSLSALDTQLQEFLRLKPEDLRKGRGTRDATIERASKILSQIDGYL